MEPTQGKASQGWHQQDWICFAAVTGVVTFIEKTYDFLKMFEFVEKDSTFKNARQRKGGAGLIYNSLEYLLQQWVGILETFKSSRNISFGSNKDLSVEKSKGKKDDIMNWHITHSPAHSMSVQWTHWTTLFIHCFQNFTHIRSWHLFKHTDMTCPPDPPDPPTHLIYLPKPTDNQTMQTIWTIWTTALPYGQFLQ